MSFTPEWRDRVESWRKELKNHFYRPLGTLEVAAMTTMEHLSPEQAAKGKFVPMASGAAWGAKWQYAWFRTDVVVPKEAAGKFLVLNMDVGGEGLLWIDGEIACARDWAHTHTTLANRAVAGQEYKIVGEFYGGHGPTPCGAGPTPPDRRTVPEPPPAQQHVGEPSFGIWDEDAYQLYVDVETLWQLRQNIDPNSLRYAEIDQGMRDFSIIVDYELPLADRQATFRAARQKLAGLLKCTNGSTVPTLYCFGHAHLDLAWLWPTAETDRKAARTFSNQLALMDRYKDYKFLQSQPYLYRVLQTKYPSLYARVKKAVKAGRIIPEGGMWVEADTNITGGESLIRQFIHGKRFFRDEFGIDDEMLWLPDVFGYSGAMPQIMRGCGIKYFSTAKIFWNYHALEAFPHNTFFWSGIDGSDVLVHLCNDYNSATTPASTIERWNQRVQKDGISTRLMPFGHGDGGGGPTRDHVEFIVRQKNLEGVPACQTAGPIEYFKDQAARSGDLPKFVGELYYSCHRGTYTSQARTKRGNRKSELALRQAEMWSSAAIALEGFKYPYREMDEAWKAVLLNQFHDILPGSSIQRVYAEANAAFDAVIAQADALSAKATETLVTPAQAVTVFNSLSWRRTALVQLPASWIGACDGVGLALPIQKVGDKTMVEVDVPACGWTTIKPTNSSGKSLSMPAVKATSKVLENELIRVTFGQRGEIKGIWDKQAQRELAGGACNDLRMYKDVPHYWDAWDINSMYTLTPVELDEPAKIEVVAGGPLMGTLRVTRRIGASTLSQDITLRRDSRRVDFHTVVEWRERHKMLKVAFRSDLHTDDVINEIQFGHIRRPTHRSRPTDADRFEVCNHKWSALAEENRGMAVLNDCKYGLSASGSTIELTLLRSPLAPDEQADLGRQEFTYSLYTWNGSLGGSGVVREAYDLNVPASSADGDGGERSILSVDAQNVIIETVKPAEDGSGDIVVRLYEAKRMASRCELSTTLPAASATATDMLENEIEPLKLNDGKVSLDFRAFEIKTIRFGM